MIRPLGIAFAVIVLAAGCGGSSSPSDVVRDYEDAWQAGNAGRVCELSTDAGDPTCEAVAEAVFKGRLFTVELGTVQDEDISGDTAVVTTTSGRWMLEERDGGWKVKDYPTGDDAGEADAAAPGDGCDGYPPGAARDECLYRQVTP